MVRPEDWVDIILRSLGYLDENIYLLSCNLPESSEGERFARVEVICACHILGDSVTTFIFKWSWPKKKPPANEVNESHLHKYSANRRILRKEAWIAMRHVANLDAAMDAIYSWLLWIPFAQSLANRVISFQYEANRWSPQPLAFDVHEEVCTCWNKKWNHPGGQLDETQKEHQRHDIRSNKQHK